MELIDLKKLKIVKEYGNFREPSILRTLTLADLKANDSLKAMSRFSKSLIEEIFTENDISEVANFFYIELKIKDVIFNKEEDTWLNDFTLTLINLLLSDLFDKLVCQPLESRPRERRLDVPENFKKRMKTSFSMIKKIVNYKTICDKFNFQIVLELEPNDDNDIKHYIGYNLIGDEEDVE